MYVVVGVTIGFLFGFLIAAVFAASKDEDESRLPRKPKGMFRIGNIDGCDTYAAGYCPSCGNPVNHEMRFCDKCSQRLDWSFEK